MTRRTTSFLGSDRAHLPVFVKSRLHDSSVNTGTGNRTAEGRAMGLHRWDVAVVLRGQL
ncbi:MAG: hypothetical protein WD271_07770 [Acidimicrobiia bacterium]